MRKRWDRKFILTDSGWDSPRPWRSRWFAKQGLRQAAAWKTQAEGDAERSAQVGWCQPDRSRAARQQAAHHDHTSRPGIIIGRKGAEIDKLKPDLQKRTNREIYHRHSGSAQARTRCSAGLRIDCAAARKAHCFPSSHAQSRSIRRCASAAKESRFACADA